VKKKLSLTEPQALKTQSYPPSGNIICPVAMKPVIKQQLFFIHHIFIQVSILRLYSFCTIFFIHAVSFDSVVLHAEWEDWAIQYVCSRFDDYRNEQIYMFTKNPTMDSRAAGMLRTMAVGYGYPMDNQRIIDQMNCDW